jgi:hypothetical protein
MEKDKKAKFTKDLRDEVGMMLTKLELRNNYDRMKAELEADEKEKNKLLMQCDGRDTDFKNLTEYYNYIEDICQKNGF